MRNPRNYQAHNRIEIAKLNIKKSVRDRTTNILSKIDDKLAVNLSGRSGSCSNHDKTIVRRFFFSQISPPSVQKRGKIYATQEFQLFHQKTHTRKSRKEGANLDKLKRLRIFLRAFFHANSRSIHVLFSLFSFTTG